MAVFPFTVRATDSEGSYADRQFNITVRNSRVERFMVINGSNAWTSPDGTSWTERTGHGGYTCEYGNGFWLILKTLSWSMLKSTDGINYNLIDAKSLIWIDENDQPLTAPPALYIIVKLKFWNGRFWLWQAQGQWFQLWSSVDGVTWKRKRLYSTTSSQTVVVNNTMTNYQWGEDNGQLIIPFPSINNSPESGYVRTMGWITSDGNTFTPVTNATVTTGGAGSVLLNRFNGLWIAAGVYHESTQYATSTGRYLYSTDGLNWNVGRIDGQPSSFPSSSLFYVNGLIYVFSSKATTSTIGYYWTSSDGLNWIQRAYKPFSSNTNITAYPIFKNGIFLLAASASGGSSTDSNDLATASTGYRVSIDGINWTIVNSGVTSARDVAAM